jgi:hypothetical protein
MQAWFQFLALFLVPLMPAWCGIWTAKPAESLRECEKEPPERLIYVGRIFLYIETVQPMK